MNWYSIIAFFVSVLGIPSLFLAGYRYLYQHIKSNDAKTDATQKGVQALLRAQMISEYNKALDKGFAPIYAKQNFENVWKNYHALGVNGVMDDIHEKYMSLPDRKENE